MTRLRSGRAIRRLRAVAQLFRDQMQPLHRDMVGAILIETHPTLFGHDGEVSSFLSDHPDAFEHVGQGRYWSKAEDLRSAASRGGPDDVLELGRFLWRSLSDGEQAVQILRPLLNANSVHVSAHRLTAEIHAAAGKTNEVIQALIRVSLALPGDVGVMRDLAVAYESIDDCDRAVDMWERAAARRRRDAPILFRLARAARQSQDPETAHRALEQCLSIDYEQPAAHLLAALMQFEEGEPEMAFLSMADALELDARYVAQNCEGSLLDAFLTRADPDNYWTDELQRLLPPT